MTPSYECVALLLQVGRRVPMLRPENCQGRSGPSRSLLAVLHLRITADIPDQHYFLHLLLLLPFYLSRPCPLRTPACTSARHAAVARSAPHHQRSADVACGRISHLNKFSERFDRIGIIGIPRWLNGHRKGFEQFALVTRQKPEFQPTRDVVHKDRKSVV